MFSLQAYYLFAPLSRPQPSPHSLPRFLPLLGEDGHLLTALPTRITFRAGVPATVALGLGGAGQRLAGLKLPAGLRVPGALKGSSPKQIAPPSRLGIGRDASRVPSRGAEGVSPRCESEARGRARRLSRRPLGWEPERCSFTPAHRGVRSPGPSPLGGLLMPEDTEEPAVERQPTSQAGPGGWRPGPLVARGASAEGEREKAEGWDPNP